MSGLKSRRKGLKGEYLVRDLLRKEGYVVDRVPASGASQGFKGDLRVRYDSKEILVEVKLRKKDFTRMYAVIPPVEGIVCFFQGAIISYDPNPIIGKTDIIRACWLGESADMTAYMKKLFIMRADSDILVLKDDRQKPIYITWLSQEEFEGRVVGNA